MKNKPTIGLALGSGSARGLAHIGVLKALKEHNIEIDMIAGCSAGALVGGLYLCGISPEMIENIALQMDKKLWIDLTVPRKGFIKGKKLENIVKLLSRDRNIEDLEKLFVAVATDLKENKRFLFKEGPICKAIRASVSIPGVFEPVTMGDKVLVDGAVIDRVPASVVKEMGAEFVIAVDVGFAMLQDKINNVFDVILQTMDVISRQVAKKSIIQADMLIQPPLGHIRGKEFHLVEECVEVGYNSTIEKIDEIKELLNQKSSEVV